MKLFALALAMGAIAGCGGGGGPSTGGAGSASTMTVTLATGSGMSGGIGTTTYTEGPINNFGYYDPSFSGDIAAGAGMLITMCSGVTGAGPCNVLINVNTSGWTPGGYLVTGGTSTTSTYLLYMEQGQYFDGIASKGTVTLTSVGNVGEPIEGSFQAILALRTNSSTTIEVSGVFSVVRDH
jgi:hypothetical protein